MLLVILFPIYGAGKKLSLGRSIIVFAMIGAVGLLLFLGTMYLGEGPQEMLESMSSYSDYTRNAMIVIDEHFPLQYGKLTLEANIYGLIPRAIMPTKPKNFGPMRLDDEFYPKQLDEDEGAPAFGVGIQYADFGVFAIVYIGLVAIFRGWLARVFVSRLQLTNHPADFFMVAFLADIPLFPTGVGWFLPEALVVALGIRYLSCIGASQLFRERSESRRRMTLGGALIDPRVRPIS